VELPKKVRQLKLKFIKGVVLRMKSMTLDLNSRTKDIVAGYIYILPSLILIMTFSVIPIFMVVYLSFTKYNVMQPAVFVEFDNYIRMFSDRFVRAGIANTLIYTAIVVPTQTILSMVIAEVIASRFRNRFGSFVKSVMFIPVISSAVLVGSLWLFLLATDNGAVNQILGLFGIHKINWIGTTKTALLSVCIASIWKNVGYFLVIFYAGIMDISSSIYQAARVDGASTTQQFFLITVPLLKPVTLLVIVLGTIWSFQVFDIVYVMTNGGPGKSTVTLVLTIYNAAFKEFSMGYASAVSVLLFVIVMLIYLLQRMFFREDA
jgi:multiple sugar transport system permease protein